LAHRGLEIALHLADARSVADANSRLGLIHMDLGELDAASNFFKQVLKSYRDLDEPLKIANALDMLGLLGLYQGEFAIARRQFEESLILLESLNARRSIGIVNTWLGIGLAVDGQYERGHSQGLFALAITEEAPDLYAEGHARMLVGYTSLLLGRSSDALRHLERSVEIFQQLGQQDELGQAHAYLAYVKLAQGNWQEGRSHVVRALQQASITRTILPIWLTLPAAAHLFVVREEPESALEMWSLATKYPVIANSAMMDELGGRHVRAVVGLLPQAVVDAAKERGRQRDLHATAEQLLTLFEN
jgi:tetratricopeptide (TPR) repeat protein